MTNYYTVSAKSAQNYFDTVVKNYIEHSKKAGEKICHIPVYDLTVSVYDIVKIAIQNGYNAKHLKNRIIIIKNI